MFPSNKYVFIIEKKAPSFLERVLYADTVSQKDRMASCHSCSTATKLPADMGSGRDLGSVLMPVTSPQSQERKLQTGELSSFHGLRALLCEPSPLPQCYLVLKSTAEKKVEGDLALAQSAAAEMSGPREPDSLSV